jgi:divalent metal cation (Fe/Co/Zn/Cd) transporter
MTQKILAMALVIAAAAVMPWLAKEKRRLSGATGSAALRADAAQLALCAYLSLIALAGLAINAVWHVKWADPISALAVLPLMVWEGSGSQNIAGPSDFGGSVGHGEMPDFVNNIPRAVQGRFRYLET